EAQEHFADVKSTRGPNHPEYKKAQSHLSEVVAQYDITRSEIVRRVEVDYRQAMNREQMLKQAVNQTKEEFDQLNARSFDYQRLKQEAEADKKLYEELITKIREAGI